MPVTTSSVANVPLDWQRRTCETCRNIARVRANYFIDLVRAPAADRSEGQKKPTPPLVCLDPDGDLILCLKDGATLLVSSKVLSLASASFQAMLCVAQAEDKDISSESPPVIDLPDDHPIGMKIVAHLVHFRKLFPEDCLESAHDEASIYTGLTTSALRACVIANKCKHSQIYLQTKVIRS